MQELGRLEKAEISCRKAISLKPDYAEAIITWVLSYTVREYW